MSKINDLIKEKCPNGVEYKKLKDCCKILDNMRKPVKKGAREKGLYPYYGANGIQDYVSDYIFDGRFVLVGEDGSVMTTSGTPIVNWAEGKIWVNNHAHVIEEIEGIMLRYLFHYIQTIDVTDLIHGNIPKLNQRDFINLTIAVPPIEVQDEIVKVLDKFNELETELETELEARQKQYEFYREELLKPKPKILYKNYNICEITEKIFAGGDVPKDTIKGLTEPKDEYIYPVISNGVGPNAIYGYSKNYRVSGNTVTISARGTVGYHTARFEKYTPIIRLITIIPNEEIVLAKYLNYVLYITQIESTNGGIQQITIPMIKKINLDIPPLEEQQKIVNILDKFDKLANDISEGLPTEIELRRKQYEYYRNKLLNFKEVIA